MYTLRTAGEVRNAGRIDALDFARVKVKADELRLARQVLGHFDQGKDLSSFTDHYQQALRAMLAAKEDEGEVVEEAGEKPAKVVNLMDALRKSLTRIETKKPARTRTGSRRQARARVVKHAARPRRAS